MRSTNARASSTGASVSRSPWITKNGGTPVVHVVQRRRLLVALRLLGDERLHHHRLEEPPVDLGVGAEGAVRGEVVDPVERHGGRDRRVGVLEAGLEARVADRGAHERGEVAAGGAAGDADEVGVDAVLVGVLADPRDGPLAVDEVVGERRRRAEAVVDVEADPALGGHVGEQRDALLALVADHPPAAVDLHERGALGAAGGHRGRRDGDVEAQHLAARPGRTRRS